MRALRSSARSEEVDINLIRQLLRNGHSVVLVEQGQPPLVVTELRDEPSAVEGSEGGVREAVEEEEVQISSRWPKGRSVRDSIPDARQRQDQVLERLNNEILALKAQIAQEEEATAEVSDSN